MAATGHPRGRWLAMAALALAAVCALPAGSASAATIDAAGWWSRTSSPLPLNPTAPHVGDGQLHVQGQPEGPTAITALRWTLAEGESSPVLTVTPADGSLVPADAVVTACRAASPWQEAKGGAWDDAPEPDCATSVEGAVADDGSTIEFDLGTLVDGTTLDIVLTPGTGSTVSLTFDRPAPDALRTTTAASSSSSDGAGFDDGATETAASPSYSSGGADSRAAGSDSFSIPSPSFSPPPASPQNTPAEVAAPPPPPANPPSAPTDSPPVAVAQPAVSTGSDGDRARNLSLLVLATGAAVIAWAWTASSPTPAPANAPATALVGTASTAGRLGTGLARTRRDVPPAPT